MKSDPATNAFFFSLLAFGFCVFFSLMLAKQGRDQLYIQKSPSYPGSLEFVETGNGRNSGAVIRLKFDIPAPNGLKNCDIKSNVEFTPLEKEVMITPRGLDCEAPFLTDYHYRPLLWVRSSYICFLIGEGLLIYGAGIMRRRRSVHTVRPSA